MVGQSVLRRSDPRSLYTRALMYLPVAVFGIKNSTINLVVSLVVLFLVVIWLALVYWTYADARRRIPDPMLIACATAASLFPFVGTIVYMIVRPPEYLDDVRERELEMQAAEARLAEVGYHLCPHCDAEVEKDFLRCPSCLRKLKDPCRTCGRPLDPGWKICPYCEAEVGAAPPQRRPRRRRESSSTEQPVAAPGAVSRRESSSTEQPVAAPGAGSRRESSSTEQPVARGAGNAGGTADRPSASPS